MAKDPKTGAEIKTPEQIAAEQKEAEEKAKAQAASAALAAKIGVNETPLAVKDLIKAGDKTVLCDFPKRVPLTLDASHGHRRVEFPAGTYPVPAWLATEYPRKRPGDTEATPGMHFYLEAHGVKVVEMPKDA